MKNIKRTVVNLVSAFALLFLLSCGGGSSSTAPPDDPVDPPANNNWDSLVWDQGEWQ